MGVFSKDKKDPKEGVAPGDVDSAVGDREAQLHNAQKKGAGAHDYDALAGTAPLRDGATTTTTTDSLKNQGAVETKSPGELDKRSPEERLEQVRGWKKKIAPRQPHSADWEELDEIVGQGDIAAARRPT